VWHYKELKNLYDVKLTFLGTSLNNNQTQTRLVILSQLSYIIPRSTLYKSSFACFKISVLKMSILLIFNRVKTRLWTRGVYSQQCHVCRKDNQNQPSYTTAHRLIRIFASGQYSSYMKGYFI